MFQPPCAGGLRLARRASTVPQSVATSSTGVGGAVGVAGVVDEGVDALAHLAHFLGRAGQEGADGFLEHQADEAAAIETGILVVAAPAVVDADELEPVQDDILRGVGVTFQEGMRLFTILCGFCGLGGETADGKGGREKKGEEGFLHRPRI